MPNYNLYNDLKQLSDYIYRNGFYAEVFYKDGQIAIVYRGSNDVKDWLGSDLAMGVDIQLVQKVDAQNFYEKIKKEYPNQKIILTGHSLGGSLAQIVGSETGAQTVTFNAYGTRGIKYNAKYIDNITNYGNAHDLVYMSNLDNQVGNAYVLNDYKTNDGYIYKIFPSTHVWKYSFEDHKLENIGDLSKALEYEKNSWGELGKDEPSPTLKASIEYNVDKNENSPKYMDKNGNRVYTREDLHNMSKEEQNANHDAIMTQYQASRGTKAA